MQKISKKLKIFFYAVLAVALLSAALLTVSLFTSYDTSENYLQKAPLPIIFLVCLSAGIIISLSSVFFIPKGELNGDSPITFPVMISSAVTALILLASGAIIYGVAFDIGGLAKKFQAISSNSQTMLVICGIFTLISVIYFALNCFFTEQDKKLPLTLVGFSVPITAALYVSVTYFDMSISINAHAKLLFHYAMISFMIWFLYELRTLIGKAMPRVYFALGLTVILFSASSSLPWLIGIAAGKVGGTVNPSYIIYSLISLCVCIYTSVRLFVFVNARALLERISDQTDADAEEDPALGNAEEREES